MPTDESTKTPIALVCNSLPPYRQHVHRRVARELIEARVWTFRTHEEDGRWQVDRDEEIGLVSVADHVSCAQQGRPRHFLAEWRMGGRLIEQLRRHRIRAVAVTGYNDPGRLRLLLWCRLHGVPCLVWGDSNINDPPPPSPLKRIIKRIVVGGLLKLSAGVLACGSAGRAYFSKFGVRPSRIFYFPLQPDYALIHDLPPQRIAEARERFGLPADRRRILFCGRLVEAKRPDLLLSAFVNIAARRPDWDLVMLGDGPLAQPLQSQVPRHLADRVRFTGNVGEQPLVAAVERACDVLVLPSDREPWALVINEALAAGLAVVSSDVPGATADLVRDHVNGRIFPHGDLAALTQCLLDVTDEARLSAMKAQSAVILAEWNTRADPVACLRDALVAVGALNGA